MPANKERRLPPGVLLPLLLTGGATLSLLILSFSIDAALARVLRTLSETVLVLFVLLVERLLVRRFTYALRERSGSGDALDLVITEWRGAHGRACAVVALEEVRSVTPCTYFPKRELRRRCRGATVYRYCNGLWGRGDYVLEVETADEHFFLRVSATTKPIIDFLSQK